MRSAGRVRKRRGSARGRVKMERTDMRTRRRRRRRTSGAHTEEEERKTRGRERAAYRVAKANATATRETVRTRRDGDPNAVEQANERSVGERGKREESKTHRGAVHGTQCTNGSNQAATQSARMCDPRVVAEWETQHNAQKRRKRRRTLHKTRASPPLRGECQ